MTDYDEEYKRLSEQFARKKSIDLIISELNDQQEELLKKVEMLNEIKIKEDKDVKRLEGFNLTALFYRITGTKEEKLTKELKEACTATLTYELALKELKEVQDKLADNKAKLAKITGNEERYSLLLNERLQNIKAAGLPQAEEILKSEELIALYESQKIEISEAVSIAKKAHDTTLDILESLMAAEEYAEKDCWSASNIGFDLLKYNYIDKASVQIELLQMQLRGLKTELTGITINTDFQINISPALKFADYFFNCFSCDDEVMDRITDLSAKINGIFELIVQTINKLELMMDETGKKHLEAVSRREELILTTQI